MEARSYVDLVRDAIIDGDLDRLERIMEEIGDEIGTDFVDVRDCDENDPSVANWLVNYGKYKNITLLELAVLRNDPAIVRYLCKNYVFGFNIVEKSYTPLHLAAKLGYTDVAKVLCETCCYSPFQYDYNNHCDQSTPFDIADRRGYIELCEWFLEFINTNARRKLDAARE